MAHLAAESEDHEPMRIMKESVIQKLPFTEDKGKHGSFTNIFSAWNGMVGSGLVFTPWAYSEAGILLGVILTLLAVSASFTTQYFIMKTAGSDSDYTDTLEKTFGRRGWQVGMALFIFILTIPIVTYFQLLA